MSAGEVGLWEWDVQAGAVEWDSLHASVCGQALGAFGRTLLGWLAVVHPEDRAGLAQQLYDCAERGSGLDHTYRVVTAGGDLRWVMSRGRMLARASDPRRMSGVSLDVTAAQVTAQGADRMLVLSGALSAAVTPGQVVDAVVRVGLRPLGLLSVQVLLCSEETPGRMRLLSRDGSERPVEVAAGVRMALRSAVPVLPVAVAGSSAFDEGRLMICLPLQAGGRTIGALTAELPSGQGLSTGQQRVLLVVTGLCAQALDRAVLHRREAEVAHTLQHQLLPGNMPDLPGLELSGCVLSGTRGLQVGGDWYDAIRTADGVALVVGDVVGKGLPATALMSWASRSVNAFAMLDPAPSQVLDCCDRLAVRALGDSQFVTMIYAQLDLTDGRLAYASAGHPPALLIAGPGQAGFLPVDPQRPVGTAFRPRVHQQAVLATGAVLVMYSDGLIERRDASLDDGMLALQRAAAAVYIGPSMPLDELRDALVESVLHGARPDDVTLLLARLSSAATPNERQ